VNEDRGASWCRPSNEFQRFEIATPAICLPLQSAAWQFFVADCAVWVRPSQKTGNPENMG
jgi:hypothetical protein